MKYTMNKQDAEKLAYKHNLKCLRQTIHRLLENEEEHGMTFYNLIDILSELGYEVVGDQTIYDYKGQVVFEYLSKDVCKVLLKLLKKDKIQIIKKVIKTVEGEEIIKALAKDDYILILTSFLEDGEIE